MSTEPPNSMKPSSTAVGAEPAVPDLHLPDWSGHLPHTRRISVSRTHRYCTTLLPKLKSAPGYAECRKANATDVEFKF